MLYIVVLGLRGIPGIQGGIETHCEQLYPVLAQNGCKVELIGRTPFLEEKRSFYRRILIRRLYSPHPKYKGLEAFINTFIGVLYAAVKRPDILHIHAVGPALFVPLARIFGLKVIVTHHGFDYQREKWGVVAKKIIKFGEYMGMKFADQRIVVSEEIKKHLDLKYGIKSVKIPNGVQIAKENPKDCALKKYNLKKYHYILMVSRFVPEKRQDDLIRAFSGIQLDNWKLVLVGDISQEDHYIIKIKRLADAIPNVIFTGFQNGQMLQSLYANAGVFVLPSSHEGLPIVILEALSFGVPVIASDISANLEIGLGASSYFKLGDVEQLKIKLVDLASKNGNQNRDQLITFAKRYSWETISKKTYETYLELL